MLPRTAAKLLIVLSSISTALQISQEIVISFYQLNIGAKAMKQNLQVLSASEKSGVGKKSGAAYKMTICQCVVTDSETGEIKVGELTMPKDAETPTPGHYEAEFKIGVDYQTKKIGGVLVALRPVGATSKASRPEGNKPLSLPS